MKAAAPLLPAGEKPFACNFCDYRAAVKSSVTQHVNRSHKEVLLYVPMCPGPLSGVHHIVVCAVCVVWCVCCGLSVAYHMCRGVVTRGLSLPAVRSHIGSVVSWAGVVVGGGGGGGGGGSSHVIYRSRPPCCCLGKVRRDKDLVSRLFPSWFCCRTLKRDADEAGLDGGDVTVDGQGVMLEDGVVQEGDMDPAAAGVVLDVDGGVTPETARLCVEAGATALVAGTSVFKDGPDGYAANITALRE